MNKSEQLFESWCSQRGWLFEKIPEQVERTPDYRIMIAGIKIYAEVKEIVANEEEITAIRQFYENGFSVGDAGEPGKTIREKIKDSYKQIKGFTEPEQSPGFLVLYDNSGEGGSGRFGEHNVLTGMFGLEAIPISVPSDPSKRPVFGTHYLGLKKSVAPDRNRYLSGIMKLYEHHEERLMIFFYHNPHAIYPINPRLLDVVNCSQYHVNSGGLGWELIHESDGSV